MPKKLLRLRVVQRRGKTLIIKEGLVGRGQKYRISTTEVKPNEVPAKLLDRAFWSDVDVTFDMD